MNKTLGTGSIDRSARVRRIKRVIIGLIALAIILPSILCIALFYKISKLEKQVIELSYAKERVNVIKESTLLYEANKSEPEKTIAGTNSISVERIDIDNIIEDQDDLEDSIVENDDIEELNDENPEIEETSEEPGDAAELDDQEDTSITLKRVYLTFDDGPSSNTSKILDILDEYGVKATFFVVGRMSDTTTPMYKRIVDEGHAIGMHSYTHKYTDVYKNVDSFVYDIEKIQSLIYEQTGVMSKLYRFPGGSSNRVTGTDVYLLKEELDKRDIQYFDWNVVSGDASSTYGLPKEEIVRKCTAGALNKEDAVILMHDLPEKSTTVQALPEIIEYFQSIGVEILPIDESYGVDMEGLHNIVNLTE